MKTKVEKVRANKVELNEFGQKEREISISSSFPFGIPRCTFDKREMTFSDWERVVLHVARHVMRVWSWDEVFLVLVSCKYFG